MAEAYSVPVRQLLPPDTPKKAAQTRHLGEDVILLVILII
jgi:hypothetical protein